MPKKESKNFFSPPRPQSSQRKQEKNSVVFVFSVVKSLSLILFFGLSACANQNPTQVQIPATSIAIPTTFPIRTPEIISIENSPLKNSIITSGDYLIRQQLPNGELAYQVNILNDDRAYASSDIRLMSGTGALYTICRVSSDSKYCASADLALNHYLENLISNPEHFTGTCFYANGICPLGGATSTIDAIYKRWQATGDFTLEDKNLISIAIDSGYFIVSMRKPEGGFYHSFDPHFEGTADADYFVTTFNGESLYALLQLYEMTENVFWLDQAREINAFMITQPVSEDYAHAYAFSMLARLDELNQEDIAYATEIANVMIAGQVRSLNPINSSISTATKIEALASIAQAFYLSDVEHAWLEREINTFITFVSARQIPDSNCGFEISYNIYEKYEGGIFSTCEDPSIRIDGVAHWINGITTFLEYKSMIGTK
ncbi:MAG TPA: hypothetical protein DIW23_01265 [Anaerolineae bacterium]|mgnify:CR=1 FL=1|nr:hypothetical protein [Anaerolineae bacterium]